MKLRDRILEEIESYGTEQTDNEQEEVVCMLQSSRTDIADECVKIATEFADEQTIGFHEWIKAEYNPSIYIGRYWKKSDKKKKYYSLEELLTIYKETL